MYIVYVDHGEYIYEYYNTIYTIYLPVEKYYIVGKISHVFGMCQSRAHADYILHNVYLL